MQISFDPLIQAEATAVRQMLDAMRSDSRAADQHNQQQITLHQQSQARDPGNAAPSTAAADPSQIAPGVLEGFSTAPTSAPPAVSAPTPPAPSAPVAPSSPVVDGERDIHGLPWDARIHSSGENRKNADGSWRARRGTDPQVKATVEAELRAAAGGGAPLAPTIPSLPLTAPPVPASSAPITSTTEQPVIPGVSTVAPTLPDAGVPPIPPVPPAPVSSPPPIAPIPSVPPVPPAPTAAAPSAGATGEAKVWQVHEVIQYVNDQVNVKGIVKNADLDQSLIAVGYGAGQFAMLFGAPAEKLQAFMRDFEKRVTAAQQ